MSISEDNNNRTAKEVTKRDASSENSLKEIEQLKRVLTKKVKIKPNKHYSSLKMHRHCCVEKDNSTSSDEVGVDA